MDENVCVKCGKTGGMMLNSKVGFYHLKQCAPVIVKVAVATPASAVPVAPVAVVEMSTLCPECKKFQMEPPLAFNGLRHPDGRAVFPKLRCEVCAFRWLVKKHGRFYTKLKVVSELEKELRAHLCAICDDVVGRDGQESYYNTGNGGVMHLNCRLESIRA